jgi:hypothetical protein
MEEFEWCRARLSEYDHLRSQLIGACVSRLRDAPPPPALPELNAASPSAGSVWTPFNTALAAATRYWEVVLGAVKSALSGCEKARVALDEPLSAADCSAAGLAAPDSTSPAPTLQAHAQTVLSIITAHTLPTLKLLQSMSGAPLTSLSHSLQTLTTYSSAWQQHTSANQALAAAWEQWNPTDLSQPRPASALPAFPPPPPLGQGCNSAQVMAWNEEWSNKALELQQHMTPTAAAALVALHSLLLNTLTAVATLTASLATLELSTAQATGEWSQRLTRCAAKRDARAAAELEAARLKTETEARLKAEAEAKAKAEAYARAKAEAEARARAEAEAKAKAEAEARARAEAEARARAEAEARARAEAEAKAKAEAEARARAAAEALARAKAEAEARAKAEAEAAARAEAEARARAEEEARAQAEAEVRERERAEAEARAQAEAQAAAQAREEAERQRRAVDAAAEAAAKAKADGEAARLKAEEEELLKAEADARARVEADRLKAEAVKLKAQNEARALAEAAALARLKVKEEAEVTSVTVLSLSLSLSLLLGSN